MHYLDLDPGADPRDFVRHTTGGPRPVM